MNEKAMRERLENESERLAARENERVRTSESHSTRVFYYIFLKASGPMAVAAATDAVAW